MKIDIFIQKKMLNLRNSVDVKCLASQVAILRKGFLFSRKSFCTKPEEESFKIWEEVDPEEIAAREAEFEKKRNKSKLFEHDFNKQHGRMPYNELVYPHQQTLYYRRRLYGKYGEASNIDPSILWPSKIELEAMKNYDDVSNPFTFQELVERSKEKKMLEEKEKQEEVAKLNEKLKNIDSEIIEFHKRVAKKKKAAEEILEKKNRLVEEVRRRVGYKVALHDKKFKEVMAQVQEEEKKKAKAVKKARKEEKQKQILDATLKAQLESAKEEEEKTQKENP